MDVIRRYLDCGDLHFGFARVKCEDCGHEYLLPFLVKEDIFVRFAIRSGWWNSANGCAKKYLNTCRIGNGYSVFQNGCESIL